MVLSEEKLLAICGEARASMLFISGNSASRYASKRARCSNLQFIVDVFDLYP